MNRLPRNCGGGNRFRVRLELRFVFVAFLARAVCEAGLFGIKFSEFGRWFACFTRGIASSMLRQEEEVPRRFLFFFFLFSANQCLDEWNFKFGRERGSLIWNGVSGVSV